MRRVHLAAGALLLFSASPVLAQRVDGHGVPFRMWDVDATVGFHNTGPRDLLLESDAGPNDIGRFSWAGSLDVGRYWTSHLKTEFGVTALGRKSVAGTATVVVPTGETGRALYEADVRQTQFILAGTYQFFENTFAHPYVSAGVRTGVIRIDAAGPGLARVVTSGATRLYAVQIPPDRPQTEVRARPFIAIGSKSYFAERIFARPEMVMAFNSRGVSQFGLRLGIGVDF